MKQFILKNRKAVTGTVAALLIGAISMSFQDSPFSYSKFSLQDEYAPGNCSGDTVPDRNYNGSIKMKEIGRAHV